jgi:hypothetical protein
VENDSLFITEDCDNILEEEDLIVNVDDDSEAEDSPISFSAEPYFETNGVDDSNTLTSIRQQNVLAQMMATQPRQRRNRKAKNWGDEMIVNE